MRLYHSVLAGSISLLLALPAMATARPHAGAATSHHAAGRSSHATSTHSHAAAARSSRGGASTRRVSGSGRHGSRGRTLVGKRAAKPKFQSQRAMDDTRATEIQTALIRAGYLSGTPSGHWDAESEAAMQKLQGDNGWQTKLVPDSRALIKLGLGPATNTAQSVAAPPPLSATPPPNRP